MYLQKLSKEFVNILFIILEKVVLTILGRSERRNFYKTPVWVEKILTMASVVILISTVSGQIKRVKVLW